MTRQSEREGGDDCVCVSMENIPGIFTFWNRAFLQNLINLVGELGNLSVLDTIFFILNLNTVFSRLAGIWHINALKTVMLL